MPKVVTPEQYVIAAKNKHNNLYKYDISTIHRVSDKARIMCPTHGWFEQILRNHLTGSGCPQCAGRGVNWVSRFIEVHGDYYDYSRVVYKGYKVNVTIGCPKHGYFEQTPDNHYRGKQGCPKCKGDKISKSTRLPVSEFLVRAGELYRNKYQYPNCTYKNILSSKIRIVCPDHG